VPRLELDSDQPCNSLLFGYRPSVPGDPELDLAALERELAFENERLAASLLDISDASEEQTQAPS